MSDRDEATVTKRSIWVRTAGESDVALLARHRVGMLLGIGTIAAGDERIPRIETAALRHIDAAMSRGEWLAWIAEERGAALGSGSAILRPIPPGPDCPDGGEEAYFINFFTEPVARRRGVATEIMRTALEWCRGRDVVRASLRASSEGRAVYTKLGFISSPDTMDWRAAWPKGPSWTPR